MEEKKGSKLESLIFEKHLIITIRVVGITLGTMAALAGIGYLIDKQFNTWPAGFIIGLVIAFPVIQIIIYKTFRNLTDKYKK